MNEFDKRTAIMPAVIACVILREREPHGLTEAQQEWFCDFCDRRIRRLYEINRKWRRTLNASGNRGRELCYSFVNHWLDAYLKAGNRIDRGLREFQEVSAADHG